MLVYISIFVMVWMDCVIVCSPPNAPSRPHSPRLVSALASTSALPRQGNETWLWETGFNGKVLLDMNNF